MFRLLIVDDNPSVRRDLATLLPLLGVNTIAIEQVLDCRPLAKRTAPVVTGTAVDFLEPLPVREIECIQVAVDARELTVGRAMEDRLINIERSFLPC